MGKHLTYANRVIIEYMYNKQHKTIADIAKHFDKHYNTIYREIYRGLVEQLDTHLVKYKAYSADVAQSVYDNNGHNKGRNLKIGNDYDTAHFIEEYIKNKRYSPYAVSFLLKQNEQLTYLCKTTIYNYIYHFVLNITSADLLYKKIKRDKAIEKRRPSLKMLGAKTIEKRPEEVKERNTFGHWELDTVYSGKDKSKACLLVFTERLTRFEIIRKIPDRTSKSVVKAIDELEKEMKYHKFKNIFKTITADNGVEFSKYKEIEKSVLTTCLRTQIYFCHAFCSSERGSNEKQNVLIRKYIPKGADISQYSDSQILHIQMLINTYPRKLFKGLSSLEVLHNLGYSM